MKEQGKEEKKVENTVKTCFVIMPISDNDQYERGHFKRVYDHIIKPACKKAGFQPIRADEVSQTNFIVVDILQNIIHSDMAICDLSSKNPNVLYELGIRQAFDLPVALIKDIRTERIFDISALRDTVYDESLRVDTVAANIDSLATSIESTYNNAGTKSNDINSLIKILGLQPAKINESSLSLETTLILDTINAMNSRVNSLENRSKEMGRVSGLRKRIVSNFVSGDNVIHKSFGIGKVMDVIGGNRLAVLFKDNEVLAVSDEDLIMAPHGTFLKELE